jgi:hypothetical protein
MNALATLAPEKEEMRRRVKHFFRLERGNLFSSLFLRKGGEEPLFSLFFYSF